MNNVITFTRIFPEYHLRKGEPTYFVAQILNNLIHQNIKCDITAVEADLGYSFLDNFGTECRSKGHTIRSGNDWKVGDKFSPQVWLGKPHASELIVIAPDIEVKKIWTFECDKNGQIRIDRSIVDEYQDDKIAKNDGLSLIDFKEWLVKPCYSAEKPFKGQIICWDEGIVY